MLKFARLGRALLVAALLALLGQPPAATAASHLAPPPAPAPRPYPAITGLEPPPGCSTTTADYTDNNPAPILDNTTITRSLTVGGFPQDIWAVTAHTAISHTWPGDLNIYLTAPHGERGTLTTRNGGTADDSFANTQWYDPASLGVTEAGFAIGLNQALLIPEGAMGHFRFQNPAGDWQLSVSDVADMDEGTLNAWGVSVTTLNEKLIRNSHFDFTSSHRAITSTSPVTASVNISTTGHYLVNLTVQTNISHSASGDLWVTLTAPNGLTITLTSGNGADLDNLFKGTLWTDTPSTGPGNPGPVTDATYTNNVPLAQVQPEGAMGHFVGVDPNGRWILTIQDVNGSSGGDVGVLTLFGVFLDTGHCQPIYLPRLEQP